MAAIGMLISIMVLCVVVFAYIKIGDYRQAREQRHGEKALSTES
jgi:hypothetical protein